MFTDSHCHITCDELWPQVDEVIGRMDDVFRCMIICTNEKELERALKLNEKYGGRFRIAFGWYPGDVNEVDDKRINFLEEQLKAGRLDVLGEIGLDYHWGTDDKEAQIKLFERQIELANKYHIPLAIHLRDAMGDGLKMLEKAEVPIIFHCWSGSPESMREALKMDSLISFAGPITYKNAKHGPACVKECPVERMLTETDSPYLAPVPKRGKVNEPSFVEWTTKKICELKDLEESEVCAQIVKNFDSLFDR